jgi:hypothetical protein
MPPDLLELPHHDGQRDLLALAFESLEPLLQCRQQHLLSLHIDALASRGPPVLDARAYPDVRWQAGRQTRLVPAVGTTTWLVLVQKLLEGLPALLPPQVPTRLYVLSDRLHDLPKLRPVELLARRWMPP